MVNNFRSAQNPPLFSILGSTYGGDGETTFALPDLRDRVPVYVGPGIALGQSVGEANHVLTIDEMPNHNHAVNVSNLNANDNLPENNIFAKAVNITPYGVPVVVPLFNLPSAPTVSNSGLGQPHPNTMPSIVLNMCIALEGVMPSV